MSPKESQSVSTLHQIKKLQQQLDKAIVQGARSGDLAKAEAFKTKIEQKTFQLKRELNPYPYLEPEIRRLIYGGQAHAFSLAIGNTSIDSLRQALTSHDITITDNAKSLMDNHRFRIPQSSIKVNLVSLRIADIAYWHKITFDEIYHIAGDLGLGLCWPVIGPELRQQYLNQPDGDVLYIGMKPIIDALNRPNIFSLYNLNDNLYLSSAIPFLNKPCNQDTRFIFQL